MSVNQGVANRERTVSVQNGWFMLVLLVAVLAADLVFLVSAARRPPADGPGTVLMYALVLPVVVLMLTGFFTLQPNEARVLVLFGAYKGTVRESGFHWGNPFYSNGAQAGGLRAMANRAAAKEKGMEPPNSDIKGRRNKISLRVRNLNSDRLKVNDKRGNPVEIA